MPHGVEARTRPEDETSPLLFPPSGATGLLPADGRRASQAWPPRLRRPAFGGDYNPEQWPPETRREDIELMRSAGVNAVTVGVFAWATLEPEPGRYEFCWLDDVFERLYRADIVVVLATPSASPPAWFSKAHPSSLPVTREGVRLGLGSRESFCPSSPEYRRAAQEIAGQLARRYGAHPALALWHVGNEFGAHVGGCYCSVSQDAFRAWLRARYGDLEALNEAWGTAFWGQRYGDWDEITVPRAAPMPVNPTQQLDFRRFSNDEFLACYCGERDVLRAITPDIPVTTNFMSSDCPNLDYWTWAPEVDLVSNDHYLTAESPENHIDLALSADLTRSLARGRAWMLMEHSTSAVNWQPRNLAKAPGEMLRNSLAHVARGSDSVMFFQWRASRRGAEKFHSAMLPHAGTDSRVWRELVEMRQALTSLAEAGGSTVATDVGIVWDWPSWWALELECRPSIDVTFREAVATVHRALWQRNLTVEFVRAGDCPTHLPVLLVPSLYLCSKATADALRQYVEQGGHLLVWFFSGIVDETDAVHPGAYPGALRDLLGVRVEEFHPLHRDEQVRLSCAHRAGTWSEPVGLRGAETVWHFENGPDAEGPSLTRHLVGQGTAWYLATSPDAQGLDAVLAHVLGEAGVPWQENPDDLDVVRRRAGNTEYVFLLNHSENGVTTQQDGLDLLTGRTHEGTVEVPPGGAVVLRRTTPH
ncbi:MAG: beta-galactosidase [Actinomycetota bacterium]|nr:beta-galactosidase [Actinomycetota bacterium]